VNWLTSLYRALWNAGYRSRFGRFGSWPSTVADEKLLPAVTGEWVRRLLRREGLTAQRVRTWKTSNDPAFDRKKTHPEALSVLSAAQRGSVFRRVGPAGVEALRRYAWARQKRPCRKRATYRRLKGTEQFLGFYDVHAAASVACSAVARES